MLLLLSYNHITIFIWWQNPPVKLSLDSSGISDGVEECGDGVWSIVGGKVREVSLLAKLLES